MMVRHATNFSFVLELSDTVLSYKNPSKLQIITSKRTRALYIQKISSKKIRNVKNYLVKIVRCLIFKKN